MYLGACCSCWAKTEGLLVLTGHQFTTPNERLCLKEIRQSMVNQDTNDNTAHPYSPPFSPSKHSHPPLPCLLSNSWPLFPLIQVTTQFLKINKVPSHTIHSGHKFPFLHSFQLSSPPLSSRSTSSVSLLKRAGLQETRTNHGKAKYNKTRQQPSYQDWARPPNRKKRVLGPDRESPLLPVLESNKNHHVTAITFVQRAW